MVCIENLWKFTLGLINIQFAIKDDTGIKNVHWLGEFDEILSKILEEADFNVVEIMNQDFRIDIVQEKYFVIKSFNELASSLADVRLELFKN